MSQLIGEGLALVTTGRLPESAFVKLITVDSKDNNQAQLGEILDEIYSVNKLDCYEVTLTLLNRNQLPGLIEMVQADALKPAVLTSDDTDNFFDLAPNYLFELRQKYQDHLPDTLKWAEKMGSANKIVLSARNTRSDKPINLQDGEPQNLTLDSAYAYLIACLIFGKENHLIK